MVASSCTHACCESKFPALYLVLLHTGDQDERPHSLREAPGRGSRQARQEQGHARQAGAEHLEGAPGLYHLCSRYGPRRDLDLHLPAVVGLSYVRSHTRHTPGYCLGATLGHHTPRSTASSRHLTSDLGLAD